MKNYLDEIELKLKKQIAIEELIIVDNSQKHKGHLHLKIKSLYLGSISRISGQKLVMKILSEDLKTKIHALEISIEQ